MHVQTESGRMSATTLRLYVDGFKQGFLTLTDETLPPLDNLPMLSRHDCRRTVPLPRADKPELGVEIRPQGPCEKHYRAESENLEDRGGSPHVAR